MDQPGLATNRVDKPTYLGSLELKASPSEISLDESTSISVRFSLKGELRAVIAPARWEAAYDEHDATLLISYKVTIEKVGIIIKKQVFKPMRVVRKGTFYWSRNPDLPYRIWVMVTSEGGKPTLPKNEGEARELLFDVNKSLSLLGTDLGRGEHRLRATVEARWGQHVYTKRGLAKKSSVFSVKVK